MRNIYVFYHFLHPDDVVSSVLFSELCAGLVRYGWEVTAFPCNRGCHDNSATYPRNEEFEGVRVERIWRPSWRQSSGLGRTLNSSWMVFRWACLAVQKNRNPDVIIVGTDPIFSVLIAIVWRYFKPKTVVACWCFDLYPEAAFADGQLRPHGVVARILHKLLSKAYRSCDMVVDIGSCMRELLRSYDSSSQCATITPWAIEEPSHTLPVPASEREKLFDNSALGLLYSGSFGRAHSYETALELARLLRRDDVRLTFSVRGNREEALRAAVLDEDRNVRIVPFTQPEMLSVRLASADIHLVTLREEWTGIVVPSKFFGALAIGRPVLFCGDRGSTVAQWIEQYNVGWVLTPDKLVQVAESMRELIRNPSAMQEMRERCFAVYCANFSRDIALQRWHLELTRLLNSRAQVNELS